MNYSWLVIGAILCTTISCKFIDADSKKVIKKESKNIIKQVVGAAEHFDAQQDFIAFTTTQNTSIKMYWQNNNKEVLGSLQQVLQYTQSQGDSLLYACNGGMYMQNQSPLGLFIYKGKTVQRINLNTGTGNFYLNPKGIFYVLKNGKAGLANFTTTNPIATFANSINYATQSGPMLVTNGSINKLFVPNSTNYNIRNGVGILPNGQAIFAMSTAPINFYNFANYFKSKGCKQALYLDGFVSRTYCPSQNYTQLDGGFGVMIGVVQKN